ncbi:inositol hexakisphosphate kinase 3 [Protopterus annectens]|uniref:inositol hexakisphosphate kinase 3 n=1 Tax=Protopterus annectens TaxID=7888 RepID=UPI001CFBD961|nr:inositol hexakisphosphate kinase 3 [Protopterus annectens]XP_043932424.1 inositol hexakisphosphate kinase 3 [Protopterus annectens]
MVLQDNTQLLEGCRQVLLEPFVHQVGGHSSMMKYDETTICKPLVSQEQWFYEALPPQMKCFTPQYKGVVMVSVQKDSSGHLTFVASPQNDKYNSIEVESMVTLKMNRRQTKIHCRNHSSACRAILHKSKGPSKSSGKSFGMEFCICPEVSFRMEDANGKQTEDNCFNPWSLHCHQTQLTRMSSECREKKIQRFLLLENVVSHFTYPCILDLKMGTRQHGDDASEEKKARQMKKCAQSTSATLGVRICGMQVYQTDAAHFLCRNKYYGRKLSKEGFQQTLFQFLHNGERLRTDLLDPVLLLLQRLMSVIEQQNSYRFYSSSLLIIYEGEDPTRENDRTSLPTNQNKSAMIDVRMIDFAHTTYNTSKDNYTTYDGPDNGYLLGLQTLIGIFQNLKAGE